MWRRQPQAWALPCYPSSCVAPCTCPAPKAFLKCTGARICSKKCSDKLPGRVRSLDVLALSLPTLPSLQPFALHPANGKRTNYPSLVSPHRPECVSHLLGLRTPASSFSGAPSGGNQKSQPLSHPKDGGGGNAKLTVTCAYSITNDQMPRRTETDASKSWWKMQREGVSLGAKAFEIRSFFLTHTVHQCFKTLCIQFLHPNRFSINLFF